MTATLQQRIDASPYLSRLENKLSLSDVTADNSVEALHEICRQLQEFDFATDLQQAEPFLIKQKQHFVYAWSLCELQNQLLQSERGEWQTRFAEVTIEFALKVAWHQLAIKRRVVKKQLSVFPNGMPGLFIFAMGKLGGSDLNFSSDVDLIAYFDPEALPIPDMIGKSYICQQVLQRVTRLLNQNGQSNFVWRVDWRLRPNASANSLAMSTEAALDYYYYRASPWHRLALMKARVIAGDLDAGNQFLNSLQPFIWRQNLDFRALDELAEIKQRINLEHPTLRAERLWRKPITSEIAGFNVKLGTGGIREIEFIANALQLVWGGKKHALRTTNTIEALHQLGQHGHLEHELSAQLVDAYQALRKIENAIQMIDNQHTHLIPSSEQLQQQLLLVLGDTNWSDFVGNLNRLRKGVSTQFESLFASHKVAQDDPIIWPETLSGDALDIVQEWEEGYQCYGIPHQLRHRLQPLTKVLSDYLTTLNDDVSPNATDVVRRLNDFFKSLPQSEQYFRLLVESPALLESIIPPLLYSPPMTKLLKQSPHIIDCYMQPPWRYEEHGFDFEYVLKTDQYETQLENIRRFVNEHLYQLYQRFLKGGMSALDFQLALSDLAETTLELSLKVVTRNMGLNDVPITVLGMGKVAQRRMSPTSDLDLVFIFDSTHTELELASRFVNRLQTAISTGMQEGIVYELDTRLRPSGRSGAPTVSVDSFHDHQLQRAHTWEHIALLSSRVVAGDKNLTEAIEQVKNKIVSTPRDHTQFLNDAVKMWVRVSEHRIKQYSYDVMFNKLRPSGLMQSEYLAACLILETTRDAGEYSDLLAQSVNGTDAAELPDIIQFWRIQQIWERLLGKSKQPLNSIPTQYLELLLDQSDVETVDQLIDKKRGYAEQVKKLMADLMSDVTLDSSELDEWHETKVKWL